MQRINTLLQKIGELAQKGDKNTAIDIDLMLDYTRVMYADLLEWKGRAPFTQRLDMPVTAPEPETGQELPFIQKQPAQPQPEPPAAAQPQPPVQPVAAQPAEQHELTQPVFIPAQSPRPQADIQRLIGINDKYLYISELFGNNRDAYEEALNELNSIDNYQDAMMWLDNAAARRYDWDDENDTVQLFYNVVSSFFAAR